MAAPGQHRPISFGTLRCGRGSIRLHFACSWRSLRGGSEVLKSRVALTPIFIIASVVFRPAGQLVVGRVVSLCECKNQRKSSLWPSKPENFSGLQAQVTVVIRQALLTSSQKKENKHRKFVIQKLAENPLGRLRDPGSPHFAT